MITCADFNKKQMIFVFAKDGERIYLSNGNMIIVGSEGDVKLQVSCFRLFLVYVIGNMSITTAILREAKKHGFFFIFMSTSFRLNSIVGADKDGNTLLKEKQYLYNDLSIAKHLVKNKIAAQYNMLSEQREKSEAVKDAMKTLSEYYNCIESVENGNELLAYEGLSSKVYFRNHFNNLLWKGRKPRTKIDWINSTLDIGYTIIFAFIDSILLSFGFDTYKGVYHKHFYMRKSLTCDLIEPFRIIIDKAIKRFYNLKSISEADFVVINYQYQLKWEKSSHYVKLFMEEILKYKSSIFMYIKTYYGCFMKNADVSLYPFYMKGEVLNGTYKL